MALAANAALAQAKDDPEARSALDLASFYGSHLMPRALMHEMIVRQGSVPVTAPDIARI